MALGQNLERNCPDQSKYEKDRLAYVDKALKSSAPKTEAKKPPKSKGSNDPKAIQARKFNSSAGGKTKGGHR